MLGGIFSDQRCALCGGSFRDDSRRGLFCPNHPTQYATKFSVRFKSVHKRFNSYSDAQRFLTGLRFQVDQKVFDVRDWQREQPLSFINLSARWLEIKKCDVKRKSWNNLNSYIRRASDYFGHTNIKEIGYGELQDCLNAQADVSGKTRANMRSCLHSFWTWLRRRRILTLNQMPEFPEASFELGFRRTIGKATQEAILEEIERISYDMNPKILLGIRWLCTYVALRPIDLVNLKEQDIDLEQGYLIINHPSKSTKPKLIPLLQDDIDYLKSLPRSFPAMPFFRHTKGKAITPGEPFGPKLFYKWWKVACKNLGIEGIDLYGGSRHSSVRALRHYRTPEEIKRATMHESNKAFERYFQFESDDLRQIYADTRPGKAGNKLVMISGAGSNVKSSINPE